MTLFPRVLVANKIEDNPHAANHTAYWGMRADYVVPSRQGITVNKAGIFWPVKSSPLHALVATRKASSDHRLVWIDVIFTSLFK